MVPAHFVVLEKLPLSPAGKLDRRALPDPLLHAGAEDVNKVCILPGTENEKLLVRLFQEITEIAEVSIDDSFFDKVGSSGLHESWKDFFHRETKNQELIDFCEDYFLRSGRPINTVLEARWWFYASNKSQVFGPRDIGFMLNQSDLSLNNFSSFFDCQEFEDYMWYNTDEIIEPNGEYKTYKKFLRRYINNFYSNIDYLENTVKINSMQFQFYHWKKIELLDLHWICMLEDATVIRTKNLPLISKKEFDTAYGNSLEYLFNTP
jgi:hypothetical protein